MVQASSSSPRASSLPLVFIYWLIISIPMGWGIYKTWQKSVPLFKASDTAAVGTPVTATTTPAPLAATAATATPTPEITIASTPSAALPAPEVPPAATPAP